MNLKYYTLLLFSILSATTVRAETEFKSLEPEANSTTAQISSSGKSEGLHPLFSFQTSPNSFFVSSPNLSLQIPLSDNFTLTAKGTYCNGTGGTRVGWEAGLRGTYYFRRTWYQSTPFLRFGAFKEEYTLRGSGGGESPGFGWDTNAQGWMFDILGGYQVQASKRLSFFWSTGMEVVQTRGKERAPLEVDRVYSGSFYKLQPVVEMGIGFAI